MDGGRRRRRRRPWPPLLFSFVVSSFATLTLCFSFSFCSAPPSSSRLLFSSSSPPFFSISFLHSFTPSTVISSYPLFSIFFFLSSSPPISLRFRVLLFSNSFSSPSSSCSSFLFSTKPCYVSTFVSLSLFLLGVPHSLEHGTAALATSEASSFSQIQSMTSLVGLLELSLSSIFARGNHLLESRSFNSHHRLRVRRVKATKLRHRTVHNAAIVSSLAKSLQPSSQASTTTGPPVLVVTPREHNLNFAITTGASCFPSPCTMTSTTGVPSALNSPYYSAIFSKTIPAQIEGGGAVGFLLLGHTWYVLGLLGLIFEFGSVFILRNLGEFLGLLSSPIRPIRLVDTLFSPYYFFGWWALVSLLNLEELGYHDNFLALGYTSPLRYILGVTGLEFYATTSLSDGHSRTKESLVNLPLFRGVVNPERFKNVRRYIFSLVSIRLFQAAKRGAIELVFLRLPLHLDSFKCFECMSHGKMYCIDPDTYASPPLFGALSLIYLANALFAPFSFYVSFFIVIELYD